MTDTLRQSLSNTFQRLLQEGRISMVQTHHWAKTYDVPESFILDAMNDALVARSSSIDTSFAEGK